MLTGCLKAYIFYPLVEGILQRNILSKLAVLKKDSQMPFSEREKIARKKLTAILKSAKAHVPYYRELFSKIRFNPDHIEKDMAYFNEIPCLTKDIIRKEGDRLINEQYEKKSLQIRKTNGSTGPAVLIYYSCDSLDWTAAANLFALEYSGKKRHAREAHLSSRLPSPMVLKDKIKERFKCFVLNRVNLLTDSFDKDSLEKIWTELKAARPYIVQGHPSTFYALAIFLKENSRKAAGVIKAFESTGEVLDKKKREVIEGVFQCKVYDRYGNAEFGVVSHETEDKKNKQKVLDFMVWPEMLSLENNTNEIILTGLMNEAMPLIRYKTGDLGELEACDDGFYLKNIMGRVHDVVKIGEKNYPTYYLQDLFDKIGGIDEFQIEVDDKILLMRIVLSDPGAQAVITEQIHALWQDKIKLEFTDFSGLKKVGWREKFNYIVG